jgi:predicted hydrocarbon binding protein
MTDRPEGEVLVQLPAAAFTAMHEVLRRERGGVESAQLLREIGLESGESMYGLLQGWLAASSGTETQPDELAPDEFWSRLSEFFTHLGWGNLRAEQLGAGVLSLVVGDWFELRGVNGTRRACHFTAGLVADLLRRVAGQDLAVLEVDSGADGTDQSRLLIGSPDTLEAVYLRMRDGAAYTEAVAQLG